MGTITGFQIPHLCHAIGTAGGKQCRCRIDAHQVDLAEVAPRDAAHELALRQREDPERKRAGCDDKVRARRRDGKRSDLLGIPLDALQHVARAYLDHRNLLIERRKQKRTIRRKRGGATGIERFERTALFERGFEAVLRRSRCRRRRRAGCRCRCESGCRGGGRRLLLLSSKKLLNLVRGEDLCVGHGAKDQEAVVEDDGEKAKDEDGVGFFLSLSNVNPIQTELFLEAEFHFFLRLRLGLHTRIPSILHRAGPAQAKPAE